MNEKRLSRWFFTPLIFVALFAIPGCPDSASKKKTQEKHEHKAGEKHEESDHKGHDHKEGEKHEGDHGHEKKSGG